MLDKEKKIEEFVLFLDNHLLVLNKPARLLVQGDRTGDASLFSIAKEFIKKKFNKPGNVYLGIVHRLDRPASGVVVFARTSKSAARLNKQFRNGKRKKKYLVLVEGKTPLRGKMSDKIVRQNETSVISKTEGKEALLYYKRINCSKNISLVSVELITGRHHQIRLQFAHRGHPVIGDMRYGSTKKLVKKTLALHAHNLKIIHPTRKEKISFTAPLPEYWPKEFNL